MTTERTEKIIKCDQYPDDELSVLIVEKHIVLSIEENTGTELSVALWPKKIKKLRRVLKKMLREIEQ